MVLFLIPKSGPKTYPHKYLLHTVVSNLAVSDGEYSDSSINLPCETEIGVSAITK